MQVGWQEAVCVDGQCATGNDRGDQGSSLAAVGCKSLLTSASGCTVGRERCFDGQDCRLLGAAKSHAESVTSSRQINLILIMSVA